MASRSWSSAGWYELSALACGAVTATDKAPASAIVATLMRRVLRGFAVNTVVARIAVVTPLPSLGWSPRIIRHVDAEYGAFRLTARCCRAGGCGRRAYPLGTCSSCGRTWLTRCGFDRRNCGDSCGTP